MVPRVGVGVVLMEHHRLLSRARLSVRVRQIIVCHVVRGIASLVLPGDHPCPVREGLSLVMSGVCHTVYCVTTSQGSRPKLTCHQSCGLNRGSSYGAADAHCKFQVWLYFRGLCAVVLQKNGEKKKLTGDLFVHQKDRRRIGMKWYVHRTSQILSSQRTL